MNWRYAAPGQILNVFTQPNFTAYLIIDYEWALYFCNAFPFYSSFYLFAGFLKSLSESKFKAYKSNLTMPS